MSEKIVRIQAIPQPGYNFHGEAHRLWSAAEATTVTVLDTEDDPPGITVEVTRHDGKKETEQRPHPTIIGQRSFKAIQANPRLRILSDKDSVDTASLAEIQAAKTVAAKLSGELADARVTIASLEQRIETLKGDLNIAHTKLASAEAEKTAAREAAKKKDQGKGQHPERAA